MNSPTNANTGALRRRLVKDVVLLQFKLLLGAARDLALTPVTLVAAAIDFAFAHRQPPRWFPLILRLGERSDHWIDLWSAARAADEAPRENVEALLARVEEVVRDPATGARRARILKRWAERQLARARARQRIALAADDPVAEAGASASASDKGDTGSTS
jgi:hypothetical protein